MISGVIPLVVIRIGFADISGNTNAPAPAPIVFKKKLRRDMLLVILNCILIIDNSENSGIKASASGFLRSFKDSGL